ncbi:hypothetical protein H9L12_00515 [Sphingomonas rhizophila]|uniref:DUF202 domain-containing protein n=1 Tax=Sphingomonas rhizophila TaxID=2071607 RepID=A0A7G9SBF5_9SPHN|nr:hypothetical protein [Sphingomonas rhizophila]QNN65180.1 hypothetical protein H9L12_00515 [Sphingomonas rhizophila]
MNAPRSTDEELWRKRFWLFALIRVGGIAVILLGVAIAFTDIVRDGGHRYLGAILIVLGSIDLSFGPVLLKHLWNRQP